MIFTAALNLYCSSDVLWPRDPNQLDYILHHHNGITIYVPIMSSVLRTQECVLEKFLVYHTCTHLYIVYAHLVHVICISWYASCTCVFILQFYTGLCVYIVQGIFSMACAAEKASIKLAWYNIHVPEIAPCEQRLFYLSQIQQWYSHWQVMETYFPLHLQCWGCRHLGVCSGQWWAGGGPCSGTQRHRGGGQLV